MSQAFLNPFMPSGHVCPCKLDESISSFKGSWLINLALLFLQNMVGLVFGANSVDPTKTPGILGLFLENARHKWVTIEFKSNFLSILRDHSRYIDFTLKVVTRFLLSCNRFS